MTDQLNPLGYKTEVGENQYYCRLMLGKFSRQQPFTNAEWSPKEVIFLPLPDKLTDDTGVSWSGDNDLKTVGDLINGSPVGAVGALALRNSGKFIKGVMDAAGQLIPDSVSAIANQLGIDDQFIDNTFPPEQITSAIQQSLGMAPNPNPSVAFNGPMLREFNMSWAFYPRSEDEAGRIKRTIGILKRRALPENSVGKSAAVLDYPHMCQLNFYPWDQDGRGNWGWNPDNSIIRYKRCIMKSVNVNYNPSNVPAFHHSSKPGTQSPVAILLSVSFMELEYMLSKDWGGSDGTIGDSISDYVVNKTTDLQNTFSLSGLFGGGNDIRDTAPN